MIRVLSLHQPWATLMAIGAKTVETRGWGKNITWRGTLAIHASKKWEEDEMALTMEEPFAKVLTLAGYKTGRELVDLGGHVIALVELYDIVEMTEELVRETEKNDPQEFAFGAWDTGRCAWMTRNVKKLDTPIALRGQLGLYSWPEGDRLFGTTNSE